MGRRKNGERRLATSPPRGREVARAHDGFFVRRRVDRAAPGRRAHGAVGRGQFFPRASESKKTPPNLVCQSLQARGAAISALGGPRARGRPPRRCGGINQSEGAVRKTQCPGLCASPASPSARKL